MLLAPSFAAVLCYIMLYPVTKSGWTRGAAQDQCSTSFFPLTYFPLRSKVAVRNSLFMSDFALPVNSLNAPSIPLAGQVEHSYAAHHFSRRSLQVGRSICLTESYGNNSFSLKANAVHWVCVCVCVPLKITMSPFLH